MATTALYSIKLKNGRKFRVFCANKSQVDRFRATLNEIDPDEAITAINGIHTVKQWEQHVEYLKLEK